MSVHTQAGQRETVEAPDAARRPAAGRARHVWAVARLSLGWIFAWSFLDKAFGLGRATGASDAWINGGSPTAGFLTFGTSGPLTDEFQRLAAAPWVDGLYMLGLLGIGMALILGIGLRVAAGAGVTLLGLIWVAGLWPERNPFMDEHIIYALVLVGLALTNAGETWGLGRWWSRQWLARRFPVLR